MNLNMINIHVFWPFQLQQKEKTNSGYKHNNKVSHGIFNLTFRMLQHTSSELTVTKSDEIKKTKTRQQWKKETTSGVN